MANVDGEAIQTAIREVLLDGEGDKRTIGSTVYNGGLYESLPANEKARRALGKPIVEATSRVTGRHAGSPQVKGNKQILAIEVEVRVVRAITLTHKIDDDVRDTLIGSAANDDADVIQQALTYPGNVSQTSSGDSTGIVSGLLRYAGSDFPNFVAEEGQPGRVETVHRFTGLVQVDT